MFLWRSSPFMCLPIDIRWNESTNHQKLVDAKQKASNLSLKISCNSHLQPTKSEKIFTVLIISAPKKPQPQTNKNNQPTNKNLSHFSRKYIWRHLLPKFMLPSEYCYFSNRFRTACDINILKWFFAFFQQRTNC